MNANFNQVPAKKIAGVPRPLSAQGPKFGQQRLPPPQIQKSNIYEEEEINSEQMPNLLSNIKNRPSTVPQKQ